MTECDNKSTCHTLHVIDEDINAMRVVCEHCNYIYIIRKDPFKRAPEMRQYAKIFKRDILQGNDNLFYKYYPEHLKV